MNYGSGSIGSVGNEVAEPRPQTDLESLLDNLRGAANFAQEMNAILSLMVIKARGSLPPEPQTKSGALAAVPAGIFGELREASQSISQSQAATLDLISMLRTGI